MNHFLRVLILLAALGLAAPSHAFDEKTYLKDYIGLTKLLRANGVEPVHVNWKEIEAMCLGLKTEKDAITYNECRYDKAIDQTIYRDDAAACDNEAKELYSDNPPRATTTVILPQTPVPSNGRATTIITPPADYREIITGRRAAFDRCMNDKGWRSSRNWQLGHYR